MTDEPDRSTYPPAARGLPQSNALSEAEPLSTQDLFNRNPEGMADRHIDAIVMQMRDLRVRLEQTATAARTRTLRSRGVVPPGSMRSMLDDDDDDC